MLKKSPKCPSRKQILKPFVVVLCCFVECEMLFQIHKLFDKLLVTVRLNLIFSVGHGAHRASFYYPESGCCYDAILC